VVRWGRSAHETEADLLLERAGLVAQGLSYEVHEDPRIPPPLADCGALVVNSGVRVDRSVLHRFGGTLVVTTTSGYDHIDVAAARARGITVARLPEARRDAVVEHALGALIGLMRGHASLDAAARSGRWARADLPGLAPVGLAGRRIAVVGLGVIGQKMARVLDALGAEVLGVDPAGVPSPARAVDLQTALPSVDSVTVHCSLGPTSRDLLSADRLARLPAHGVVVNTARGEVLDVRAAVALVRAGRLRGLAVDVFPVEPYPDLAAAAALPQVWFTPHGAGYTVDLGRKVAEGLAATVAAWRHGRAVPYPVG
jgi:phosphoglycerate dehydrogenase-like enzyme